MSLARYYMALTASLSGGLDLTGTLARWSVRDSVPDPVTGEWRSSSGNRVLEPVGPGFSYTSTTLTSGKPAIQFTGGPRLRLRGGLDLSASTSMAYILVFESYTGATQVIIEHSGNYDAVTGRFIVFIESATHPNFHFVNGSYSALIVYREDNVPYLLSYRIGPVAPGRPVRQNRGEDIIEDIPAAPGQFGKDEFYVGGRGGQNLPFYGKLSALHLFSDEPSGTVFNNWLAYYKSLYL